MNLATVPETRRPTSLAEARDAVLAGGTLLVAGGGTKSDWGADPESVDAVVETSGLDRIRVHNAADATIKVEAGLPLARLQRVLAEAGQWVALDGVGGAAATVGGIFATDDAGPQRLAYGTLRDHVIGVTVVLADGTVARSGGFVIKNVAGYDLGRLFCGSLGTLGMIAEISLKVHPRPPCTATVRAPTTAGAALRAANAVADAALEPIAADYAEDALWLRFAGRADGVRSRIRRARDLVALNAEVIEHDAPEWDRRARALLGVPGETVLRIGTLPTHLTGLEAAVRSCAAAAGVNADLSSSVLVGAHTVRVGGAAATDHARFVTDLRQRLGRFGPVPGHAVVRRRLPGVERLVDVWGPPPSAVGLMRAVKRQLDPERRFAPGRYVGDL